MSPTSIEKDTLRKQMIAVRRQLTASAKKQADRVITAAVLARSEVRNATVICIYQSFPQEVSTGEIIETLIKQKRKIVLPPASPHKFVGLSAVDVFIIPGVAFDLSGYRLGRGKGYYDRLLAGVNVQKIGLSYECQIVSGLPHDRYDIPMDVVITEKKTYG